MSIRLESILQVLPEGGTWLCSWLVITRVDSQQSLPGFGISNLADWYRFHTKEGKPEHYARMILSSLGNAPGISKAIDLDYRNRSPIFHLKKTGTLRIDLNAGVKDGHAGSVPIFQTMRAFNVIAKANKKQTISENEMNQLWDNGFLKTPTASDLAEDKTYTRKIYLQRSAGPARVTIFEGGHESLPQTACQWLSLQCRETSLEKH